MNRYVLLWYYSALPLSYLWICTCLTAQLVFYSPLVHFLLLSLFLLPLLSSFPLYDQFLHFTIPPCSASLWLIGPVPSCYLANLTISYPLTYATFDILHWYYPCALYPFLLLWALCRFAIFTCPSRYLTVWAITLPCMRWGPIPYSSLHTYASSNSL